MAMEEGGAMRRRNQGGNRGGKGGEEGRNGGECVRERTGKGLEGGSERRKRERIGV